MSNRPMYYDIDGNPLTLMEWAQLFETCPDDYRRIAATQIGDVWVSTVWLGIEHQRFETMCFPECDYQVRTSTKEAALAEHDQAVAFVESGGYAARTRAREGDRSER